VIYSAKLAAPVKKAYGERCYGTNIQKICEQLSLDPEVSGMEACVLCPKDVAGIMRKKVQLAIEDKNPDVCIIYIYNNEKEADLVDTPFKKQVKKTTPDVVKDIVEDCMGNYLLSAKKTVVSRDAKVTKTINSKPEDVQVTAGGLKGGLFKNKATAAKKDNQEVGDELKYDVALDLWYKIDALGNQVYINKKTGKEMTKMQVEARKTRIKQGSYKLPKTLPEGVRPDPADAENVEIPDDLVVGDIEDEEDDIPVNLGEPKEPEAPVVEEPVKPNLEERVESDFERNLKEVSNFHDWGLFKEAMSKDAAIRQLLEENTTYQGVVQMLSVLDTEIKTTYYDKGLTSQQKFEKVLEIGNKRSILMATHNDILARKVLDVIDAVTIGARRTVNDLLDEHRKSMEQITVSKEGLFDETELHRLVDMRSKAMCELLALVKSTIQLYQAMDLEVSDVILDMDKRLPSDNEYINEMVGSAAEVLTPTNSMELARTMMRALQEKREAFVLMEEQVRKVIDSIRELFDRDEAIIQYQQHITQMLKAHRVEDAVIIDSVIKNILNVYIGQRGSGLTATALTWSGCLARRRNTLLIDLSNESKLGDYGEDVLDLDEFMRQRIDRPLCVVAGTVPDVEALSELITELKTRLDYYAHINVILDSTQLEYAKVLAKESLTVNYITNCTKDNMEEMGNVYASVDVNNVAQKVLMVNPTIDVLKVAEYMNIDVTSTKCVSIPDVPKIKSCGVLQDKPYEYVGVRTVFEEAFK
jgi:hypothetical protein